MVNSTQYEALKKKAIELPILRKLFPLGETKILDIDFKEKLYLVNVDGVELSLRPEAWKDLLGLLKINDKLLKGLDSSVGHSMKLKLLNVVKQALAANGRAMNGLFIINPTKSKVLRILKQSISLLSPVAFFDLFETQMNRAGELQMSEMFVNENGTLDLNVMATKSEFNVGGYSDENFYPGASYSSNYNSGTAASSYTFRAVCTNGMILARPDTSVKLKGTSEKSVMDFLKGLEKQERLGWKPAWHDERVVKAINTSASLGEAMICKKIIEQTPFGFDSVINLSTTYEEYDRLGVKLDLELHKSAAIDMSVWELVNKMTDFASHARGAGAFNRSVAMKTAGMIFSQPEYGTEAILPTPSFLLK